MLSIFSEATAFIKDCGNMMSLGYATMHTAIVMMHRFYMFHSFRTFPRYVTACSCLFLAGKVVSWSWDHACWIPTDPLISLSGRDAKEMQRHHQKGPDDSGEFASPVSLVRRRSQGGSDHNGKNSTQNHQIRLANRSPISLSHRVRKVLEEHRSRAEGADCAKGVELPKRLAGADDLFTVGARDHCRRHDVSRLQDDIVRCDRLARKDAGAPEVVGPVRERHDEERSR